VQLLVADVIGIRRQHTPGTAVRDDHTDALFRATRAHANTTESIGALILIAGFAIAAGGDPAWVNGALWAFLLLRIVHAFAYYFDLRLLRSIAFAFGMGALFVPFGAGMRAF
jgi:uncharacterized MAPEG superfamily protein